MKERKHAENGLNDWSLNINWVGNGRKRLVY